MIDGKTFRQGLDKFFKSPTCQGAWVQIELPNGEMYDITGAKLLENQIIGTRSMTCCSSGVVRNKRITRHIKQLEQ